jgi:hypothetical protein
MNLRIHRAAVAEIDRYVDYYESREAGLGAELEDTVDVALEFVLRFPEAAPRWRDRRIGASCCSIGFRTRSHTRSKETRS